MRTVIERAIGPGLNEVSPGAEGRDGDGIEEEAACRDRLSGLEWEELGWFDDPESLSPWGSGRERLVGAGKKWEHGEGERDEDQTPPGRRCGGPHR